MNYLLISILYFDLFEEIFYNSDSKALAEMFLFCLKDFFKNKKHYYRRKCKIACKIIILQKLSWTNGITPMKA